MVVYYGIKWQINLTISGILKIAQIWAMKSMPRNRKFGYLTNLHRATFTPNPWNNKTNVKRYFIRLIKWSIIPEQYRACVNEDLKRNICWKLAVFTAVFFFQGFLFSLSAAKLATIYGTRDQYKATLLGSDRLNTLHARKNWSPNKRIKYIKYLNNWKIFLQNLDPKL